jgi:hypothetical protein
VPLIPRREDDDHEPVELAALADGSTADDRRAEVEAQIAASPELTARFAEQQRAVALTRAAAAETEAPHALRTRIDARRRAPVRRVRVAIGAVAVAAAAVAIGIAVFGSSSPGQQFDADLAATGVVPGASGSATLTKTDSGWRIKLDASGLPRLDDGRFYQAWLKSADGTLVPIGTFNEGRDVTLWAGVSPLDFSTITVTRERADGDQASSGQRVLVGTVDTSS